MRNGTPANGPWGRPFNCSCASPSMDRQMAFVLTLAWEDCSNAQLNSSSGLTSPAATSAASAVASKRMYSENFMPIPHGFVADVSAMEVFGNRQHKMLLKATIGARRPPHETQLVVPCFVCVAFVFPAFSSATPSTPTWSVSGVSYHLGRQCWRGEAGNCGALHQKRRFNQPGKRVQQPLHGELQTRCNLYG